MRSPDLPLSRHLRSIWSIGASTIHVIACGVPGALIIKTLASEIEQTLLSAAASCAKLERDLSGGNHNVQELIELVLAIRKDIDVARGMSIVLEQSVRTLER